MKILRYVDISIVCVCVYRLIDGHVQDFNSLSNYLMQFSNDSFPDAISDFHLLLYIATNTIVPMKVCKRLTNSKYKVPSSYVSTTI